MSQLLTSGKIGNIQTRQLQEQRKAVSARWEKTGLLEGLAASKKGNVAQLLENQAHYLLESTQTSDVQGFDMIVFPMVRRVFSRLLANEIVSVQTLNLPSGLLFYLDAQVSTTWPTSNATSSTTGTWTSVYDAHYNNLNWEPSFGVATAVSGGTIAANVTVSTTSSGAGSGYIVKLPYSGGEQGFASLAVRVWCGATQLGASSTTVNFGIAPQTWKEDLLRSNLIAVVIPSATTNFGGLGGGAATILSAATEYKTYASLEGRSDMGQVKLTVSSVTVSVKSRKLKTQWSPELAQDLAAYHSIDAEAELTALLSEELAAEIDREILRDLIMLAPFQTSWNYDRTATTTRTDGLVIPAEPSSGYITQKEWNQTLMTQINKVSAAIHKATLRGGANWVVCSTEVASVLEDVEKFHAVNMTEDNDFNMGIENIGNLGTRYKVYKDPYLPEWVCLIGHKGASFMEAGYVYAPYIPFQLTPTIQDPDDFTPRKGIMTRYAKKCVNNRYFGLIRVVFPTSYAPINYGNIPTVVI
jgi:hypothetical protein